MDKVDNCRNYTRPAIRLVLLGSDEELLQGVIETSGTTGPNVDPEHPDNPEDPILVNFGSVWDQD